MGKVLRVLCSLSKDEGSVEGHQKDFTIKISSLSLENEVNKKDVDLPTSFLGKRMSGGSHLLGDVFPIDTLQLATGDDGEEEIFIGLMIPDRGTWSHGLD